MDGHSVQAPVASNGTFSDTIFVGAIPVVESPYTISYSYAGDATSGGNFNAAETDTSTTLTVNAAPLTITANSATWVYGTPQTLTYTASGLQNSETIGNVVLTTNATTSGSGNVNAGTWTITSSDATGGTFTASNYNITYVAGSLVVTPASVTGSFTAANKPYDGTTTATVTGTSLASITGDNVSLTDTGATFASANAGTQTVTLNGAGLTGTDAGNYSLVTPITTTATIAQASLPVTGNPATMVYGGVIPTFTTSTLPSGVTETTSIVDPVYSTSGNLAVGTYNLDTVLGGTGLSNYSPTVADGQLTVTPASVTGSFTAANKPYDGMTTATVTSTSLTGVLGTSPNADNVQLAHTGATFASANANSTPQTVTLNGASLTGSDASDYSLVTPITTTATINQAPLTITANNDSGTYGTTPPPGLNGVSYTGFVDGQTSSVLTTLPTVTTTATSTSPVGSYPITGTGAVDPNYAISYEPGTYTVTPAALTVTATSIPSKVYGTTAKLTYTENGLVNSDTITSVTETSAGAVKTANVGSYPIDISNAVGTGLSNYNINYVDGTLTVTTSPAKANATIHVTGYDVTYNGLAHSATGMATGVGGVNLASYLTIHSTHTNAGVYTDTWTFTDPNYVSQSGKMTDVINRANVTVKVAPYNVTYNGAWHWATGTVVGVNGQALTGLNLNSTLHINAGTYRDAWTFTDTTGNYSSTSGMMTDIIRKANAKIIVNAYNVLFDGRAHASTGVAIGVYGQALPGLNLGGTVHLGGYNTAYFYDRWTFTDTTGNYNSSSGVAVDVIRGNQVLYRAMYHPFYPRSPFYGRFFMW